ncbi:MAG: TetR/AcrR family transcriptional regulator [Desulfobacula sp.]|nr:TetR/AcrR family transcriptional regulator [Desulfobacula sp.]
MPPRFKFTKTKIIESAFNLVQSNGWNNLSTRALASELGSSARPIYSFFKSMDVLEEELVKMSYKLLHEFMIRELTGDLWIDHGIGYVMFAREEKHLYRGINNEKNIKHFAVYGQGVLDACTNSLSDYPRFHGLTKEQIYQIQATRLFFAHGLAFQVSNSPPEIWEDDIIAQKIQQGSIAIYDGLKKQFDLTSK